ncbi:hypothetical protein, partial [Jannaschia aquimarina]|uniref:hypothetical protein n=1 Tax=Jannaschia aquimarina TaxID=935700 RepID=UPI001F39A348
MSEPQELFYPVVAAMRKGFQVKSIGCRKASQCCVADSVQYYSVSNYNLGEVQVRDRRLNFSVEFGFYLSSIHFDNKCKTRTLRCSPILGQDLAGFKLLSG